MDSVFVTTGEVIDYGVLRNIVSGNIIWFAIRTNKREPTSQKKWGQWPEDQLKLDAGKVRIRGMSVREAACFFSSDGDRVIKLHEVGIVNTAPGFREL
jgi:hypothetical protein